MNWLRIKGVFFRYFYVAKKGLHQLADLFYWPLVDILIWGLTSTWLLQTQAHIPNIALILLTAQILWQVTWRGSVDISVSLLQEFWHRNLVNLFSTPLKLSEWIFGMLLLSLCKLVLTVSFGSAVVYFLFSLNVFSIGWAFLPFTLCLLIFGWALSFLASSLIIYYGHRVEMFAWMVGVIFLPFSAVFYPVHVLPEWAQVISWCLPTTYIFEGMRAIIATNAFPTSYFWSSLSLDAIFFAVSLFIFKFAFNKTMQKGLARLE